MMMIGTILAWTFFATALQPPVWMQDQVTEELKPFSQGIKLKQVEKSFQRIQNTFDGDSFPIILVRVEDGKVSWVPPKNLDKVFFQQAENFCSVIKSFPVLSNVSLLVCLEQNCEHPIYLHQLTVPIFTTAKSKRNHKALMFPKALLTPEKFGLYSTIAKISEARPWTERNPIILWRPKTLKNEYLYNDWEWDPSIRFLLLGKRYPDCCDFHLSKDALFKKIPWWAQNYFLKAHLAESSITPEDHLYYRYLLVCDQMHSPQDLDWQLFSGSLLFKGPSKCNEWYYSQLVPDEHFVPMLYYGEDLVGRLEWAKENEDDAAAIARKAKFFAEKMLSADSQKTYFWCLFNAYSKLCDL